MKRLIESRWKVALCGATMIGALGTFGSLETRAQPAPKAAGARPLPAAPGVPPKPLVLPEPVEADQVEFFTEAPPGFGVGGGKGGSSIRFGGTPGKRGSTVIAQGRKGPEVQMRLNEIIVNGKQANQPLIVRTSNLDAKVTEQLNEDMAVMSRILDKAAEDHGEGFHHAKAAGIDILALSSGVRPARTLYIEDYGVIFTLNVGMPLKGAPKNDEVVEKEVTRNEEWEEAKSELYGRKRRIARAHGHAVNREFSQGDVDELRAGLVDALKNATNIRNLRPEDWITVVVRGMSPDFPGGGHAEIYADAMASGGPAGEESSMILRVKKSDLDEAAKNPEAPDMQKAVKVTIY